MIRTLFERAWPAVLSALALASASGPVRAEPPPAASTPAQGERRTVLLVRSAGDEEVMDRVRAELAQGDFDIVELGMDEGLLREPLAVIASGRGATAALRFDAERSAIEVFSRRPESTFEETIIARAEETDRRLAVLRAVEALRAPGLAAEAAAPELPPERSPAPVAPAQDPQVDRTSEPLAAAENSGSTAGWLSAGPGALLSAGGTGVVASAALAARVELPRGLCFEGLFWVPLTLQEVAGDEGSAELRTWLAGGALDVAWLERSAYRLRSAAGVAAAIVSMRGNAGPGFRATSDRVTAALPFARTTLELKLTDALRLESALLFGVAVPEVRVAFGAREAARWGRPVAALSLAVDARVLLFDH